jgi:hypothetical protein
MRKSCNRRPRAAAAPMIAVMLGVPEMEITERSAVDAFAGGWAVKDHFDRLADCRDLLMLAASEKDDKSTLVATEIGYIALSAIKDRHDRTGKFGVSGDELATLRLLVEQSEDFWRRQNGTVFARHYDALKRARKMQYKGEIRA